MKLQYKIPKERLLEALYYTLYELSLDRYSHSPDMGISDHLYASLSNFDATVTMDQINLFVNSFKPKDRKPVTKGYVDSRQDAVLDMVMYVKQNHLR